MKRFVLLTICVFFISVLCSAQSLELGTLIEYSKATSWSKVYSSLQQKGWEYHNSEKVDKDIDLVTMTYDRSSDGKKASGWLKIYIMDEKPALIVFDVFSKAAYSNIIKDLEQFGFLEYETNISDTVLTIIYHNSEVELEIKTKKEFDNRDGSYFNRYSISILKLKPNTYESDIAQPTEYYDDGSVKVQYTVVNNQHEGAFTEFYKQGGKKLEGYIVNGEQCGHFVEYDEYGNKTVEYELSDGKWNGTTKLYENGKLATVANYKNDIQDGEIIYFYYNEENVIWSKIFGQYKNDKEEGEWNVYVNENGTFILKSKSTHKNGLLHGPAIEPIGDELVFCNYTEDILNGYYIKYKDLSVNIFGGYPSTDTTKKSVIKTVDGSYSYGLKTGHWRYYKLGQLICEGDFVNGKKEGLWTYYQPSVNKDEFRIMEEDIPFHIQEQGSYKNGKLQGEYHRYSYSEEKLISCGNGNSIDTCLKVTIDYFTEIRTYDNGVLHGQYELLDSEGELSRRGNYNQGVEDGEWILLIENEYWKGEYYKGRKIGTWKVFDKNMNFLRNELQTSK